MSRAKLIAAAVSGIFILLLAISSYWSNTPDVIERNKLLPPPNSNVVGFATTTSLIFTTQELLDKPGGYLSNDILPPSVMMDNMPAFEFGALEQIRDLALIMRKEFSRSQSQSIEDVDLAKAQPKLNADHKRWAFRSAESEYYDAIGYLLDYRSKISDPATNAQFYARADNLTQWLALVQNRLGSLSARLAASVGQQKINTDLAGESAAKQSTPSPAELAYKTPWMKIDDVFYEARGASWALLNFLKAVEIDFVDVLERKNARISLQQIIRELEATQDTVWSPMVLNGSGFGIMPNHSLVMANYISRANAAVIDLNQLLTQG
ncbi:DUF2333 family protein [Paraferrimonas sp. SM1919]|uniref:DUF2333 family protein n=1 Tax=Paraferrimonas sp. SM1919 TaxID=2662263 RepID=UPI0013D2D8EA|nr:DUF2333 family protein [Paraferrimonas sp. SM1919]